MNSATKAAQAVGAQLAIPELDGKKCEQPRVSFYKGDPEAKHGARSRRNLAEQIPANPTGNKQS